MLTGPHRSGDRDRWSLLILRECFLRKTPVRGVPAPASHHPSLLAERLRKLVRFGALRRIACQELPKRYECILTVLQHRFCRRSEPDAQELAAFQSLIVQIAL